MAHGLTCKRFGGEVHEIGILFLFLMPCLYCNVSDSWLFREKSKRLWVTAAGSCCDLCMFAAAVAGWRLTVQNSLVNYLAYILLSVLGLRVFFNFNPLLRLDGYYFLSDVVDVPNLQPKALEYFKCHIRRLLWGAARPRAQRGRLLLIYGILSWLFSLTYLTFMLIGLYPFLRDRLGPPGIILTMILGVLLMRGFRKGMLGGEVRKMVFQRRPRTICWCVGLAAVAAFLCIMPIDDRAGGSFQLRPVVRAEVRAPVAGFIHEVYVDENSNVSGGSVVAHMEVPNLLSRIAQKRAEAREATARLRLLETGARPEEVDLQRRRVERAQSWYEEAERHRTQAQEALDEELQRLDRQIDQCRAECDFTGSCYTRARRLLSSGAVAQEQFQDSQKKWATAKAQLAQVQAQKRSRSATGIATEESESSRRRKELAEARAALVLLEVGSRPEEVEAGRALVARVREELRYLEDLEKKTVVTCPVAGLVSTPRMSDKIGQYVREGEVICLVEEPSAFEAEITLNDQEVTHVGVGQDVELKVRTLPFETFSGKLDRISPRAVKGDLNSTVTVYTKMADTADQLRPGMVGHARIICGRRPIATIWVTRLLRFLRTEFL
jgi:multidrug resistance efflux pump